MMQLISNGEPYVYTHQCTGGEKKGDIMSMEGVRQFIGEALRESFLFCGDIISGVEDKWEYPGARKQGVFRRLFSSLKQQPDLVYWLKGDSNETWFYIMPNKEDISLLDMKFIAKSVAKRGILPVLIVGELWCFDTNGQENICGATYAARFEPISLLRDKNDPLPQVLSQNQLIEKVALCWQTFDAHIIEPYLDKNFHYTSDAVFYEMSSRREYMGYLCGKFDVLKDGSSPVEVQVGHIEGTNDSAVLLHSVRYNQSVLVTIQVNEGRIVRMRMSEYNV